MASILKHIRILHSQSHYIKIAHNKTNPVKYSVPYSWCVQTLHVYSHVASHAHFAQNLAGELTVVLVRSPLLHCYHNHPTWRIHVCVYRDWATRGRQFTCGDTTVPSTAWWPANPLVLWWLAVPTTLASFGTQTGQSQSFAVGKYKSKLCHLSLYVPLTSGLNCYLSKHVHSLLKVTCLSSPSISNSRTVTQNINDSTPTLASSLSWKNVLASISSIHNIMSLASVLCKCLCTYSLTLHSVAGYMGMVQDTVKTTPHTACTVHVPLHM